MEAAHLQPEDIGILVLAAGYSKRFGSDKRHWILDNGKSMLATSLERIPASITNRYLVFHPGDEKLAHLYENEYQIIIAKNATQGMGESLASGVAAVKHCRGLLVALADMPLIQPASFTGVQRALCDHPIVIPCFRGKRGHPVGFQAEFFEELSRLRGDQGARLILEKYKEKSLELALEDEGILRDFDTLGTLEGLSDQAKA